MRFSFADFHFNCRSRLKLNRPSIACSINDVTSPVSAQIPTLIAGVASPTRVNLKDNELTLEGFQTLYLDIFLKTF